MAQTKLATQINYGLKVLFSSLRGRIQVYALIGSSGTGKSFRARLIADRFNIRFIIDDGILIKDNKIVAGRSAKRESAYLAAVKTAIFADRVHRWEVRSTLERMRCRRLLILATSDRMMDKICSALEIGPPVRIISIEEVASPEEIQKAIENRKMYGRHVIPVPAKEVRRVSPRIVTDEIKLWSRYGILKTDRIYEKTLVRPEFSTGAAIVAPDNVLKQAIRSTLEAYVPGAKLAWYKAHFEEGYHSELTLALPAGGINQSQSIADVAAGTGFENEETVETLPKIEAVFPPDEDTLERLIVGQMKKQTGIAIKTCTIILRERRRR